MCLQHRSSKTFPTYNVSEKKTTASIYSLSEPFHGWTVDKSIYVYIYLFITAHLPPIHSGRWGQCDHLNQAVALLRWRRWSLPHWLGRFLIGETSSTLDDFGQGRKRPRCVRWMLSSCNQTWLADKSPIDGSLDMSQSENHQAKSRGFHCCTVCPWIGWNAQSWPPNWLGSLVLFPFNQF